MRLGKQKIAFIGSLLLAIFTWYWCSATLFSHEHFIDGERIVHSHPLAGSSHTHSSSQLQTISHLAAFLALVAPVVFSLCRYDGFRSEITTETAEKITSVDHLIFALRAPPASLL